MQLQMYLLKSCVTQMPIFDFFGGGFYWSLGCILLYINLNMMTLKT